MKTLLDISGTVNLAAKDGANAQRDGRLIVTESSGVISADLYVTGELPFSLGGTVRFNIAGCFGEANIVLFDLVGARMRVNGEVHGL